MFTGDEKKAVSAVLVGLFEVRGIEATRSIVEVWLDALSDLPAKVAIDAIQRFIRESSDYPTPAGVRKLAGVPQTLTNKQRAELAWEVVRRAIHSHGGYMTIEFSDPIVTASIHIMGGWVDLCDTLTDEMKWKQKEFIEVYETVAIGGVGDTSPLVGISDNANHDSGRQCDNTVFVDVGLPSHPVADKLTSSTVKVQDHSRQPKIESTASGK